MYFFFLCVFFLSSSANNAASFFALGSSLDAICHLQWMDGWIER